MDIFLDYLWTWIVLTFVMGAGGYTWYVNDQRKRSLVLAVLLPFLTLALGLTLYYGVDTDRKSITRSLEALIAAVEDDDVESVCKFISSRADDVQNLARTSMGAVSVSRAKYHNLKIEVNDAASPPIAHVRFSVHFYWKTKSTIQGFAVDQAIPQSVRFEIEMVKSKEQPWLLTKCLYFPLRGY